MKSWKVSLGVFSLLWAMAALAERVPPGTDDEIAERLQPFGELCRTGQPCAKAVADAGAASGSMSGEAVYNQFCNTCHGAGVAGAPVTGNSEAWDERLAKGMETLWEHTLQGFNAMPPKGTCMACSEEELRGAMEYMVEQAR